MPAERDRTSASMVISVLVLMLLIGYAIYNKVSHKSATAINIPATSLPYLTINKVDESETPKFSVDVEYPEFRGLGKIHDDSLNELVASSVASHIDTFKKEASGVKPFVDAQPSTLSIHFDMKESTEHFVSVVFTESSYIAGAAHPNDFVYTFNYDPAKDRVVELSDLFKSDSDYLSVIGPIAREKLLGNPQLASVVTSSWIAEGTAPKMANFSAFSLSSSGVTLYFNPYQVAAYAAGVISVTIPFSDISSITDPTGPISIFAK